MNAKSSSAPFKSLSLLLLVLASGIQAQEIRLAGKPNPTVDVRRLARIDDLVNAYIGSNWIKGAVTIVVKDGQLAQYKGYGLADAEANKPMPSNAVFRIMSQTKAVVSVGAMMLYEEGRFLLDDPIANVIPEFKHPVVLDQYNAADGSYTTVPAKREITFRDLLTHTSGLDYPDIGSERMRAIYTKAGIPSGLGYFDANLLEKMKLLAKLPLAHQPGEKWTYGLNSDLLGCLIEVMSGTSLEDYLKQRLFLPLGMKDTAFNLASNRWDRLAAVYTEDDQGHIVRWGKIFRNIDPDYPKLEKHYFSGGAGLSSTALDYAIFLQMLLNRGTYGGHTILAPRTVELMVQNQIGDLSLGKNKFGLGFEIVTAAGAADGARNAGTFAWGGYYGTSFWADPKEHLVCLIMTQQTPNSHGDLSKKFETLVYSSLKD
jgi:CubicO group peptidase (beta-lactamase class C family)